MSVKEVPDSNKVFKDTVFMQKNSEVSDQWVSIKELYPKGANQPLLPDTFSRDQFGQGNHYECFMLSALATLVRFPDVIRNCFVTKKVRQDGRYTFQFFRGTKWEKVEIDDMIPLEDDDVLYCQSPTEHWWPLLLEKAYAKFYSGYDQLEGCTMQEAYHDISGFPVLNIPMQAKLAKAAGVNIDDGQYWTGLGQQIKKGEFLASILTKDLEQLESIGIQTEQQYGILDIFSLTGSVATSDIVIHLHNPFEDDEYDYSGPLNKEDGTWTAKQRAQYPVDDRHSIFMPLPNFIKMTNSMQLCFLSTVEPNATSYHDEWSGATAGGNPTFCTWRKNPLYLVRNNGAKDVRLVVTICQEDQRRFTDPDEATKYIQCGIVLTRYTYPNPIATFWVTGNNHKPAFKSLFLNSREVSNMISVPPQSLCYLVPSTMNVGSEAPFDLLLHQLKNEDYSSFSISKLSMPDYDWEDPAKEDVSLTERAKDRVDFYVDMETDAHILLHQSKPFVGKTGGDAMTEDYMGMYLYDDTDRRIGGVHAATNFREISVIHHLPRSGRYAVSLTCPRAKGEVPAYVTIVGCHGANTRIVETPEDATMFDDEDDIDEGDDVETDAIIDYVPIHLPSSDVTEVADSDTPFEDKRFYNANRGITTDPWVHIGDLYPEGKTKPLLPDTLSRDQFTQGEHYECCCLTAFAAIAERHPDVIRNCFVSKEPRKDGRYTFQFHRYGQWLKVEIDDRIPQVDGNTLYCRSPTHHWWPLLLEKAYAKFYTLYDNLEGVTQQEVLHDFTGRPVVSTSTERAAAEASCCYFDEGPFWHDLRDLLADTVVTAQAGSGESDDMGLQEDQHYAVLDIIPTTSDVDSPADTIYLKMYNPFEEAPYTGPMNKNDTTVWTPQLRNMLNPDEKNVFYMPASEFAAAFSTIQQAYTGGVVEPGWHFNSDWNDETNGGNPSLISWRNNPVYVVTNTSPEPVQIVAMVREQDQRHLLHTLPDQQLAYPQKGLTLAQSHPRCSDIPTYLVTMDNHKMTHKGLFFNTREVANVITLPPSSLSYLVGSCMYHDKTRFILSYWFFDQHDASAVEMRRFQPNVAREMPAIENILLENRGKERVDFQVDAPTDVHILVRQDKPFSSPQGGDVMAQDFIGAYLYDDNGNLLKGSQSATCYREISIVEHIPAAGHYILAMTCPRAQGEAPCHVEIVASEQAHVRIIEPPEDAEELMDVDLGFLDPMPEGIPLSDLPLHADPQFQSMLDDLRALSKDPNASPSDLKSLQDAMNARAHELAKELIGKDRPQYLRDLDLEALNPILDDHDEYMGEELRRHNLKADPRNHYKVKQQEEKLRALAEQISDQELNNKNLDFLDQNPEGIPLDDVHVLEDPQFASDFDAHKKASRARNADPATGAAYQNQLNNRAHELARAMHEKERFYLDPEPEGVPLECLPLNTDPEFNTMENKLRGLNNEAHASPASIKELQEKLNSRAHEMAANLKDTERDMFMEDEYAGVPRELLTIDSDPTFHADEVARLRARAEDPDANAAKIKDLEDRMNARALELAGKQKLNDRAFLDGIDFGLPPSTLYQLLDADPAFLANEAKLRELKKDPRRNAKAIADLEAEMAKQARQLAEDYLAQERAKYLKDAYEGRPTGTLPLSDDVAFRELENEYLNYREDPNADPARLQKLKDQMDERATEIARDMNRKDRPKYLGETRRGVPIGVLPLDEDPKFSKLERERARGVSTGASPETVATLEDALRQRADELVGERLANDRDFLDANPEGIPIACLDLSADRLFTDSEEQRAALVAENNPSKNRNAIEALQDGMNAQAHGLARGLKADHIAECVDPVIRGVPRELVPIAEDQEATAIIAARAQAIKKGDQEKAHTLGVKLNERAHQLANDAIACIRANLDQAPLQVPLAELDLDTDRAFKQMEVEAVKLSANPDKNKAALDALYDDMDKRAHVLAEEKLWKEREANLDNKPEGRRLRDLPLNSDDKFMALEKERHDLIRSGDADPAAIAKLDAAMNERAHQIAHKLNADERTQYIDRNMRGVPLEALALSDDDEFIVLEQKRAAVKTDDPNSADAQDLEVQLRDRAANLAERLVSGDRAYLDTRPEGVPLRQVPIDSDPTFKQLEERRAQAKVAKDAAKMKEAESALNERAHALANDLKEKLRAKLQQEHLGVPLSDLPLDEDAEFNQLEEQYRDAEATGNGSQMRDLLDKLNARATELADQLHQQERAPLDQLPEGMPLSALPLNDDSIFGGLEKEARALRKAPKGEEKHAGRLAEIEDALNHRAAELAMEERAKYLDAEPEGLPLASLNLPKQTAFLAKEAERRRLLADPNTDPSAVKSVEAELNAMAHALARDLVQGDRDYLDPNPEGVNLAVLPLDTDAKFHDMELERARLKAEDPKGNASKIQTYEDKLNERAHELALAQKKADLEGLDPTPEGVPLELLKPHDDSIFSHMVDEIRELKKDPSKNAAAIEDKKRQMNDRAHALAAGLVSNDRGYLDQTPEGVPLDLLDIDGDRAFKDLETRRANLKAVDPSRNAAAIKELERQLNDRVHQMAKDRKAAELEGLDKAPSDIPLEVLDPYSDAEFMESVKALRALDTTDSRDPHVAAIKNAMNARCHAMARGLLDGDRGYLKVDPLGVPLSLLPLSSDPEFHKAEVRRAILKAENPQRNAAKIKELEDQLNVRAMELAEARLRQDLAGLDEEPEGIPLTALNPHSDKAFSQMVDRRRALESDAEQNAGELSQLIAQMNDRAHQLARERLEGDRGYLDKNPEGVPLAILPLDTDAKFRQLEGQRAALKAQDPRRNAARIQELEGQLNERAHELAKAQKAEDLRGLNPNPRGIPIELLNPHDDSAFAELVVGARALKTNKSRDPEATDRQLATMADRVDALAKAVMDRDYLDPAPEDVPLAVLDLDGDAPFTQMEAERATLKLKDGRRNAAKIKELEDRLNDRAHELARAQRAEDIRSVDTAPQGIPKELLKLHDDATGASLISDLRERRKDSASSEDELRKLEDALNARAHEIAKKLKMGDRDAYLDPNPLGIPLDDLPLDTDPAFNQLESETAVLKAADPRANAAAIKSNENLLNDRAYELARMVMEEDLAPFAKAYEGIPTRELEPHKDKAFAEAAAKRRRQKRDPQVTWKEDLEQIMGDRLVELAKEKSKGDLYFLDPEPEGVPLEEVPILADAQFTAMRQEREQLKSADALGNRDAILDLEKKMNDRSHELARDILARDLSSIDASPLGIPLELLQPRKDETIANLIPELRRSRRLPALRGKTGELEKQMNDRALALAQAALQEGRERYLDPEPEGVPVGLLPLDTDPAFHELEAERAVLRMKDPVGNSDAIKKLESQLNARAHELARQQLTDDLKGIDQFPEGVPLSVLNPHHDSKMAPMIQQLRLLKKDPLRNADKIKRQEADMNERAHEMARDLLKNDRSYLKPNPLGVPLSELPLDTDEPFHDLEVRRAVEKARSPGSDAVTALEDQLNARATELAKMQLAEDLRGLNPAPFGVPLALLNPHKDERFAAQIPELRRLNHNPARNAAGIRAIQDKLNGRDAELAEAFLEKDRNRYLDADIEGLPWSLLPLSDNVDFKSLEDEKLALQAADPATNAAKIADMEAKLNALAHELAQQQLRKDRGYLDQNPEGVALAVLPLDTDPTFRALEAARAAAKANRSTAEVRDLEEKLNARAHELATEQKQEDLRGLNAAPRGIPIEALKPHEDPLFAQLVDELRELKKDADKNAAHIADVQSRMNDRAAVLADNALTNDRGYLQSNPEGIPLRRLPLDTDPEFHDMEVERAVLKIEDPKKNQSKIRDLEDELNRRARELAKQVKEDDLRDLDRAPRGIPLELLQPHKNPQFAASLEEKSQLIKTRSAGAATQPVVNALNEQATELADRLLKGDRDYLDRDPEGVPLSELPLDTDDAFHNMEVQRAILKLNDPVKNAAMIEDLEDQLNNRAHELAREMLAKDRDYLDPEPLGVPLKYLPLNTDSKFHQMEMERRRLKSKDPKSNAARINELEDRLNERAAELAKKQLDDDLAGLDREPEGYPLEFLHPHQDSEFASLLPALRESKAAGDVAAVRKLQEQLNERTRALAKKQIAEDRAFLDQKPEGVPLDLLPINSDPEFHTAEKELRAYKAASGKPDNKAIADVQRRMEDRAHELAREHLQKNRGFLDPEPEGVPIEEVPLNDDPTFRQLEVERLRLLPTKGASRQVADLEARLNARAHELAKEVKENGRDFLRDYSHDLPKGFIALDGCKEFTKPERELRRLRGKSDSASMNAAAELQRDLQNLADDIAEKQIKGDREQYLELQPMGVDIDDVPIDQDKQFHDLEVQRAMKVAEDPVANKDDIKDLEKQLNDRARELAQQVIEGDRDYLPAEIHGIPRDELPLDTDDTFRKLERKRRVHKRGLNWDAVLADEDLLNQRAGELAEDVIAQDLAPLRECYRNIPKQDLKLHEDDKFRELANKRRRQRGKGRVNPTEMAMLEDEMDRRACEIADDVIDNERGFLDQEPEGMYLTDVPLDADPTFAQLEAEYRRRSKDPRAAKQNKQVLRELALEMNNRSHALARQEFNKTRDFMDPEPEGIPLYELGLDEDPEFKDAEILRYRNARGGNPDKSIKAEMEARMEKRAAELAREQLAADRGFLDPEPEGVPLSELPLDEDQKFGDLARERRRQKKGLQKALNEDKVRALEDEMNKRAHEMAKDFLETERAFLEREPEGVPLADLPLNSDAPFRAIERDRLKVKRESGQSSGKLTAVEMELTDRARQVARDLLKKERAFLEQEPLGVPLEELPLNFDAVLNPIERRRRALRKDPKRNQEPIRACEDQMAERVTDIAGDFIAKERAFMDQEPEGVPLRYLPLGTDKEFHDMELQRRKLRNLPESNKPAIAALETRMNERAHVLAKELVEKGRAFLDSEPLGVPIADVPLNGDEEFRKLEEQRRAAKQDPRGGATAKALEERLNERARGLAADLLRKERAFMDQAPLGIPLEELPLNNDRRMREIERTRRHLRKENPQKYAGDIAVLEDGMQTRAYELAQAELAGDRGYLDPEPCGVPLADLPLDTDNAFHQQELDRREMKKRGRNLNKLPTLETALDDRAHELAADFIQKERAYLDQEPEGIPLTRLPLDKDGPFHSMELERRQLLRSGQNPEWVKELERRLNERAHQLALEIRGWQDKEFHDANRHVAEQWPRICELYPEGRAEPLKPEAPSTGDAVSAPEDIGYLSPFIAALGRHPVLLQRLMVTDAHPVNAPYTFIFFDPNSSPVYVDIDDRVPCTNQYEPKFTQTPNHMWYPLLLEKAYAKFVGGYEQMDNCTPHETLRDLTGRPVTHTPFDDKLADAANTGDYTTVEFWRGVAEDLGRGDVILAMSNGDTRQMDGIHPQCSYPILAVIETVAGSRNPADVVVKLQNSYRLDAPVYDGPLSTDDVNWSDDLRQMCRYDPKREDIIFMPLPTFLRNFSSMQSCHINCGDRLTATGTWDRNTAGGNPKFTSFRNNPIFLVENKSSRAAAILTEVRHTSPMFVDPDGLNHYPQTGIALLQSVHTSLPATPLITNSTHRFLQKGIMLDSREVCAVMEIPPSSTCYVVPYTMKAGQTGSFNLSVYPGMAKVSVTPLHFAGLSREPATTRVTLTPGEEGKRVDFTVSAACDVHILLHQDKISDERAARKGDAIAEDDCIMTAFTEQGVRCGTSGEATNAREHSLVFKATQPGRYSLLLTAPNQPTSGNCPCTLSIYTPKRTTVKFVPPPAGARPLQQARFPTLPKAENNTRRRASSAMATTDRNTGAAPASSRKATTSLPPLNNRAAATSSRTPGSRY